MAVAAWLAAGAGVLAQKPPLLAEKDVAAMANELSGETAKRNLEGIARFHRQRGSTGLHSAAELVAERLRAYGLSDVAILQFPADGKIFYGTLRSRPAWDAEFAELREISPEIEGAGGRSPDGKHAWAPDAIVWQEKPIASYEAEPVVLAEDSESADVVGEVVNVGEGTKQSDYSGKDVKGKIVLVSAQPGAVQDLAVGKFGAAGIVSFAQNQKTAWSGDDQNLIRWGHLESFSPNKTFAFMISLKTACAMKDWLAQSNHLLRLHAVVRAGRHPGNYEVVTATIPGADPKLKDEEIAFSCHLDHQRPGANDNASGCVTILEVARTLQKLISEKRLPQPARTVRFIFPSEIEGTMALLNAKPEFAKRIKAVIHMDMVGGGLETKAVFHVTRGPMSLPSFVHDVAWAFAEWVNQESYKFAATGEAEYPMTAPAGGKEPLRAEYSAYTMGSDHDVYQDSSFGIPTIYLNDWPDRYIHTNFDSVANIDPTKLKRAAFIGGASGYFLALTSNEGLPPDTWRAVELGRKMRQGQELSRSISLNEKDQGVQALGYCSYELEYDIGVDEETARQAPDCPIFYTTKTLFPRKESIKKFPARPQGFMWKRKNGPTGPLAVFGYDYFADHAKAAGVETPKLLGYQGLWGGGEEYAYEVLNFANGKRNVQQIRDAVSAEYGPVPLELVAEYLAGLEKIGIVDKIK
jgi:aminopeptidase YwaD